MLTEELQLTRLENASLQEKNQLAPPGTIRQASAVSHAVPESEPKFFPEGRAAIVQQQSRMLVPYSGMPPKLSDSMIFEGQISTGN